jgi:membrane associated rhomboid family serine protease
VTRLLRGDATLRPYAFLILRTFVTCMFLHAGLMHLLGNLLYLWIFGDNVEDRLGHVRFLLFYLLCGVGASVAHIAFNPNSPVPVVGASGAIAGVLGAYLLAFPRASVDTLVVLGIFITILRLPAFIVLGFWFVLQYLGGLQSMRMANMAGGVAWWAHVGGFVLGMLLLPIFQKPQEKRREYHYYR